MRLYFSIFLRRTLWVTLCSIAILSSCSVSKQIGKRAAAVLLKDSAIATGHIGISIYEPATGKYWYNHNADKYFIPASNTKLFTLYAGMKYLGDSLVGLRYNVNANDSSICFQPAGDPTFLLSEFREQPVLDFLKKAGCGKLSIITDYNFRTKALGKGWAWDDFGENYMAERSGFPINGNLASFYFKSDSLSVFPTLFYNSKYSSIANLNKNLPALGNNFKVLRKKDDNYFQTVSNGKTPLPKETNIPFKTTDNNFVKTLLENILGCKTGETAFLHGAYQFDKTIYSRPSDSLFKPMMYRSDNFFAEQTLLMASNELLGYMNEEKLIDTILRSELKDLAQKPKWVDGSGLSRYNLFTPQSFVYILHKMRNEFGWERMTRLLPTGGTGTLASYYRNATGYIYAKTGTLSNNCALSGYLVTQKGKLLIFSVLANNYMSGATPVRRAVEQFLLTIRENY